jgi:hypothetical protein
VPVLGFGLPETVTPAPLHGLNRNRNTGTFARVKPKP